MPRTALRTDGSARLKRAHISAIDAPSTRICRALSRHSVFTQGMSLTALWIVRALMPTFLAISLVDIPSDRSLLASSRQSIVIPIFQCNLRITAAIAVLCLTTSLVFTRKFSGEIHGHLR